MTITAKQDNFLFSGKQVSPLASVSEWSGQCLKLTERLRRLMDVSWMDGGVIRTFPKVFPKVEFIPESSMAVWGDIERMESRCVIVRLFRGWGASQETHLHAAGAGRAHNLKPRSQDFPTKVISIVWSFVVMVSSRVWCTTSEQQRKQSKGWRVNKKLDVMLMKATSLTLRF